MGYLKTMTPPKTLNIFISIACTALVAVLAAAALGVTTWAALIPAVASLVSTFLGASFAFHLNTEKEKRKLERDKIAAIRLVLFVLAQQRNALGTIWNSVEDKIGRPDSMINLPPSAIPDYSHLRQDLMSLSFMIAENPNLLLALSVEDERFRQTLVALISHKEFHVNELQPAIEQTGIYKNGFTLEEMEAAIGERIFGTADTLSSQVYSHLSSTRKTLPELSDKIHTFAKSLYPEEKFLVAVIPGEK